MNADSPITPRSEIESRLTALLLGELPHEQAAALHQKLAQDAELAKLYERLKQTIDLVRETVASPVTQTADQPTPLKLNEERRQKLLQQFKTVAPKEFARPRRRLREWLVPVGIAAALVLMLAAIAVPNFVKARHTSPALALRLPPVLLSSDEGDRWEMPRVAPAPVVENITKSPSDLNRNASLEPRASKGQGRVSGASATPVAPTLPAPSRPTGTAIVLPKSGEGVDATATYTLTDGAIVNHGTTTITVAGGANSWTKSGTLRGFYDDNINGAVGWGGGGGYGGGGGSMSGSGGRGDGRQMEIAGANSYAGGTVQSGTSMTDGHELRPPGEPAPPLTVAGTGSLGLGDQAGGNGPIPGPDGQPIPAAPASEDYTGRHGFIALPSATANGNGINLGASSSARSYHNSGTIGDATFALDDEKRGLAFAETPAPASVKPSVASGASTGSTDKTKSLWASFDTSDNPPIVYQPQNTVDALRDRTAAPRPMANLAPITGTAATADAPDGTAVALNELAGVKSRQILLESGLVGPDSANNPAKTTVAGLTTAEPQEQSKLALKGATHSYPSSGYYAGGAYGGYSSLQPTPSGGDQGVGQNHQVLRSPKEGGMASESASREVVTINQKDQKALGFNWYLGNTVVNNGQIAASTPPPAPSEPVSDAEHLVPLELKLPAPAFKGTPRDLFAIAKPAGPTAPAGKSGDQVPILGDLPLTGRLFRNDSSSATPPPNGPTLNVGEGTWFKSSSAPATPLAGGKPEAGGEFQFGLGIERSFGSDVDLDRYANQSSAPTADRSKGDKSGGYTGQNKDEVVGFSGSLAQNGDNVKSMDWTEEARTQVPAAIEDKAKANTLVRDGKLLYELGKLDDAGAKLKEALKEDPHNEAALYYLNLESEAKFRQAAKSHEISMRQDMRAVEQAWASPAKPESLPVPRAYARANDIALPGSQTITTIKDQVNPGAEWNLGTGNGNPPPSTPPGQTTPGTTSFSSRMQNIVNRAAAPGGGGESVGRASQENNLTKEAPLALSPPTQQTAVNESVYRQANTIELRRKLADARAAQDRGDLASAAKDYDQARTLEEKIGSGVEAEREQTVAGLRSLGGEIRSKSSIVLPSTQPETTLALNGGNGTIDLQGGSAATVNDSGVDAAHPNLNSSARPPATTAPAATDENLTSGLHDSLAISEAPVSREGPSPLMSADTLRKLEALRIEKKAELLRDQAKGLDSKVAADQERLKNLEELVERAEKQDAEKAAKTRPYFEAKRELDEAQRFRQILDAKIASEKIDTTLPKTMMVETVDKAVPATTPSSSLWDKIRGKPGEYQSKARIKVERDQTDIASLAPQAGAVGYDPYFIQSEEELIRSEAVLGKVVDDLDLRKAWAKKKGAGDELTKEEAVALLKGSLDLKPVKNTSLVEIGAKSENAEEAARIANAVADAYKGKREEQRGALSKGGIKALEERFAEQEEKVKKAQEKVDELRAQLNIPDAVAAASYVAANKDAARGDMNEKLPPQMIDFRSATLGQVLDTYGLMVGRQVLRPANLPSTPITLSTATPLTKGEAVQALEAALAVNGITVVAVGDKAVKAIPEAEANMAGVQFGTNSVGSGSVGSNYVTKVVQLKHAKPSEVVPGLQPLSKAPNAILPLDGSRLLVLRDSPENVKRMSDAITQADAAEGKEDAVARKPVGPAPIPQPEVQTAENAFSTFSLNVSDVSFKLAAASLEKGLMPDPANVRSEEFINAFDYRDPEPPAGVPVAFAWERAQYPFAQNRDLLRFSVKTAAQGRQPGRPLNLVLLLDNSGSMERADRVRIIREALRVLAEQLQPQDKLSVITFARTPRLFADGAPGSDAGAIAMALTELTPQGGTNLEDAMNLAYATALRHYLANGINRVVLLTDGAANLGNVDPEALKQKVEANRKQGVALDCFGIGWEGYNDDLLEVLTRNGDGRYAFLNTVEEVADEFAAKLAGALQVAASDVKVQVEFNPARVTAYRQIGYAKHQLKKEQFRDNTVNAAQIGAAEAGNALYTVEVNPSGTGPLCTVRARFRIPGTSDYREHAWEVPFDGAAVALDKASPAMRLAATGSALSEWLVASPFATEVTPDRLLGYLSGVPEVYGADARPKKLEWMIRQAKSIAGK